MGGMLDVSLAMMVLTEGVLVGVWVECLMSA